MQEILSGPLPMILMMGLIFYFLLLRPQQQKMKEHRKMIDNVRRGDTVVTAGGVVGKVAKVKEDGEVLVDISDTVQIRVVKSTLSEVRSKGEPEKQ